MTNSKPLELRQAVLRALSRGMLQHDVAQMFRISQATVSRWLARSRAEGTLTPRRTGGDRRSRHAEQHLDAILALARSMPVFSLRKLQSALAAQGIPLSYGTLRRLTVRHKTALATARAARFRRDSLR